MFPRKTSFHLFLLAVYALQIPERFYLFSGSISMKCLKILSQLLNAASFGKNLVFLLSVLSVVHDGSNDQDTR